MRKRWYDFLGRGVARSRFLVVLALLQTCFASDFINLPTVEIQVVPSGAPIRVGDGLRLKVTAPASSAGIPPGAKVELPEGTSMAEINREGWELVFPSDLEFQAVPIHAGKITLPSLEVKSEGKGIARTNPLVLEVASAISPKDPNPTAPSDVEPPVGIGFPLWVAGVGLVLLALVVFFSAKALALVLARQRPQKVKPPAPRLPEEETALLKLKDLEAKNWLAQGKYKNYYFGLSEILKEYLGARYRFDALECTSSELLAVLEDKQRLIDEVLDSVEGIFEKLDIVKFTDQIPASTEPTELIQAARELIHRTKRPPQLKETSGDQI